MVYQIKLQKPQIVESLKVPNSLFDLKKKVGLYNDHILNLHSKKVKLKKKIEEKKKKLLTL
jgi:hypothetical protein